MTFIRSVVSAWVACSLGLASKTQASPTVPTVAVKNGSYTGIASHAYNQEFFLGMPYAQVRALFESYTAAATEY